MRKLTVTLLITLASGPAFSDAMSEAITKYSDRERKPFNLLEHLDWKSYQENQPTDAELEAAGVDRSQIDIMRPYLPGGHVKQLYPILRSIEQEKQSDAKKAGNERPDAGLPERATD